MFFGDAWESGICDDGRQVATPVGDKCVYCDVEVEEGDQGTVLPCVHADHSVTFEPQHRECGLASVLGGGMHLTMGPHAVGTCHDERERLGITRRQDAIDAWDWVQRHGVASAVKRSAHGS